MSYLKQTWKMEILVVKSSWRNYNVTRKKTFYLKIEIFLRKKFHLDRRHYEILITRRPFMQTSVILRLSLRQPYQLRKLIRGSRGARVHVCCASFRGGLIVWGRSLVSPANIRTYELLYHNWCTAGQQFPRRFPPVS